MVTPSWVSAPPFKPRVGASFIAELLLSGSTLIAPTLTLKFALAKGEAIKSEVSNAA